MATITGSISPSSITSDAGALSGTITVTFTDVSQDDDTNKSTISFKAKGNGTRWLYGYGFYWSYDNTNWNKIKEFTTTSDYITQNTYTKDGWQTGSFTVDHDDDGERTIYFKIKHLYGYGASSSRWAAEDGSGYNAKATVFACTLSTIPLHTIRIRINGEWKKAFPYVRVNGEWKKAKAYIRTNGEWKKGK